MASGFQVGRKINSKEPIIRTAITKAGKSRGKKKNRTLKPN